MKKALLIFLLVGVIGFVCMAILFKTSAIQPDTLLINDVASEILQAENQTEATKILQERLAQAYQSMDEARAERDGRVRVVLYVFVSLYLVSGLAFYIYCQRSILAPFSKLRGFAQNVAMGKLDIPLEMDRHGRFGAFSESFDLMREELKLARENERKADQSKKELVASLSHDIKTPIASIKAVTELMQAKGEADEAKLNVIMAKADQIDLLITDMFQATLEELQQLKVSPAEIPSTVLPQIIKKADYENKAKICDIPECIVTADELRLQQVFDNIINNAYKYGGDKIRVKAGFEEDNNSEPLILAEGEDKPTNSSHNKQGFLAVEIIDNGSGIAGNELPLMFEKFYRGANAQGKSGSGLGLFISRYLVQQMGGDVVAQQREDGFAVKVLLKI